MGAQTMTLYCTSCGQDTGHTAYTTNHLFHLVLTMLTLGLWVVVWILAGITSSQAPKCSRCRQAYSPGKAKRALKERSAAGPRTRLCPFCAEEIKVEAIKCRHCGSAITELR